MEGAHGFGSPFHLAWRFFGSLVPGGPTPSAEAWAFEHLLPGEQELFGQMSGPDRRHAIGVARRALRLFESELSEPTPPRHVVAAALLHDVGKTETRLGTFGRVGATVAAIVFGRARVTEFRGPETGDGPGGLRGRVAGYLAHDRLGAELLEKAGSDPFTIAWARDHHLPASRWTVEEKLGDILKRADGD